ncbi:uncharacterized protein LOC114648399 isoform X1 [Erpetoichthys calabaricus]|uniref:uncharacterized protein LOC114648399 isoform X1 n=1 Tax=Erpetoichthys calabaricus TaxID=27687 RepID=UPI002234A91C|nr:uncharacterized protein LOC114648399 isoform X1 [Erpetoichthys calabaricus]
MLNCIVRSVLDVGELFFGGSGLSEKLSHTLPLLSLFLGGVVFFVVILYRRKDKCAVGIAASPNSFRKLPIFPESTVQRIRAGHLSLQDVPVKRPGTQKKRPQGDLPKTNKKRQEKRKATENRASGDDKIQDSTDVNKKLKPKKKKKKAESLLDMNMKWTFSGKEIDDDNSGGWMTQISSREKRQIRKERLKLRDIYRNRGSVIPTLKPSAQVDADANKQRCDCCTSSQGTWSVNYAAMEPVTFGTVPDISLLSEDLFTLNQNSDWSPPTEEWGHFIGEVLTLGSKTGEKQIQIQRREKKRK